MKSRFYTLLITVLFALALRAGAETLVERSLETRFQIDLKVPDAVLRTYLPPGWTSNVAPQGPAKDCNLRLIFADRVTINGPDGKPVGNGSSRVVYLAAPVKDPSGNSVQLIIGGITDDAAATPGPFGAYLAATKKEMTRTTSITASGAVVDSQDWVFEAQSGEHLEMHIQYERGIGNLGKSADVKFYSAKDPSFYQISRQEQVLDILRNVTTTPKDRVKSFTLKISGGSYGKLFDGAQQPLSWDNILWIDRSVLLP